MLRRSFVLGLLYCIVAPAHADEQDGLKVGVQPDGRIVVPTNQVLKPAGRQIAFPGRPVDLAWCEGGKTIVIKNMRDLVFLNPATGAIKQTLKLPVRGDEKGDDKPGFSVIGLAVRGERIYATDAQSQIRIAVRQADGIYGWEKSLNLAPPQV